MTTHRALLLTDVVDSTRLTERLGDAASAELWASHDRIARDLLPRWRGCEIDKSDGMLMLFDDVADATGYALAYHDALAHRELPIQARAGIHFGPVTLRANAAHDIARGAKPIEVGGVAVPIAARVMSVARGGQTLLSADARAALDGAPGGVATTGAPHALHSHGHWRLQGITEPLELFEIGASTARFSVPPDGAKAYRVVRHGEVWKPVRDIQHSVPAERDGFVGRAEPLRALAAKFDAGARLVCVLGIGGVGKTRLAIRFGWSGLGDHPGGTWFCDLSQARSVDGILFAVAQGLNLQLGKGDPVAQIGRAISGRGECLVILDNFEQVARHADETLGAWLERAPQARFVVTTREVLGIVGEETFALEPLGVDDGAALFVRRAAAMQHGYAPSPDDLAAIGQLVKVLDGLPLAIELAAARVRVMPPRTLLERMHERFDVLLSRSGRRDRQATLRAAFDWSWELLSDPEKAALAALSVFEGGFTLESAAAVIGASMRAPSAVDLVHWLVDKSFVRQLSAQRFDLLESVRDYAAQHLRSAGRFRGSGAACEAAARARHWRHFAAVDERRVLAERCVELNNLVAACRAAAAVGDAQAATACLTSAWAALLRTGPYRVGLELAQCVEWLESLNDAERARVHWVAGCALDLLGAADAAREHFDRGLACAPSEGANEARARLLHALGSRQMLDGEMEGSHANLSEAHRLASVLHDTALQAATLNSLGNLLDRQARVAEARDTYERALALARSIGERRLEGGLLGNLGGLHLDLGALDAARSHYELAIALASEVGDQQWEGNAHCNLGLVRQAQGDGADARAQFDRALIIARETGHVRLEYTVLCNLGILLTSEGELGPATEHLERAVCAAHAGADRRAEGQFRGYLALALARQGRLGDAAESLEVGARLLLGVSDRLSYALLLCDRAEVERLAQQPHEAERALGEARAIALDLRCGADSEIGKRLAALEAVVPG